MVVNCDLCGLPMEEGEEMFKFHGYSGPCPGPMLPRPPSEIEKLRAENVQLREVLTDCLQYLPDRNDALNYAATNDGRVGELHLAVARARAILRENVDAK